jgi:hypothetical protein
MRIYLNNKILLLIFLFITGCNLKKVVVTNNNLNTIDVEALIKNINIEKISKDWITIKGKIIIKSSEQNIALGANFKIRKDSLIWLSITAPIIGEASRVMISKDSIYYINRTNSTWMIKSIDYASEKINTHLSYDLIEQIITSQIHLPDVNYTTKLNGSSLLINAKQDSSSYIVNIREEIIKEVNLSSIDDEPLQITYSGFQLINDTKFPKELSVKSSSNSFNLEIKYSKIKFSNKEEPSFNISKLYNEIN